MTEPVAYIHNMKDGGTLLTTERRYTDNILGSTPLYSKSQLYPHVKMTQTEFNEWKELYYQVVELSFTVHKMLDMILDSTGNRGGEYTELAKRLYQNDDFMSVSKKQAELVDLFINYSPDNPEETIEIVPDMKWFVRSKDTTPIDDDNCYSWLIDVSELYPEYVLSESHVSAVKFDTKEEAEKWTNPLTEAVQLPVEGE